MQNVSLSLCCGWCYMGCKLQSVGFLYVDVLSSTCTCFGLSTTHLFPYVPNSCTHSLHLPHTLCVCVCVHHDPAVVNWAVALTPHVPCSRVVSTWCSYWEWTHWMGCGSVYHCVYVCVCIVPPHAVGTNLHTHPIHLCVWCCGASRSRCIVPHCSNSLQWSLFMWICVNTFVWVCSVFLGHMYGTCVLHRMQNSWTGLYFMNWC